MCQCIHTTLLRILEVLKFKTHPLFLNVSFRGEKQLEMGTFLEFRMHQNSGGNMQKVCLVFEVI
jgi:hypothetical protein